MIFIKIELNQLIFDSLFELSKKDKFIIKDFGYEKLVDKGYIHNGQQYIGASLKEIDGKCCIICRIK